VEEVDAAATADRQAELSSQLAAYRAMIEATYLRADDHPRSTSVLPLTVYVSDESVHEQVEAAVEKLLESAGLRIIDRSDPVIGSWFRQMRAGTRDVARSPRGKEIAATALHAADTRLVLAQDAAVTATLMQNLGPVLTSLHPTKDAALRIGALLIVKVNWVLTVHQLTAAQQLHLDHKPELASSPHEILAALRLTTGPTPATRLAVGEEQNGNEPTHRELTRPPASLPDE
jgi:hypothetical protein